MAEISAVAFAIMAGVSILLQVFKYTTKDKVPVNYYPLIAMFLGIVVALGTILVPELRVEYDLSIPALIVAGGVAGLSASGFYDLIAKTNKKDK